MCAKNGFFFAAPMIFPLNNDFCIKNKCKKQSFLCYFHIFPCRPPHNLVVYSQTNISSETIKYSFHIPYVKPCHINLREKVQTMMSKAKKSPHIKKVFVLYFTILLLITTVLSLSLLKQSQQSLLSYSLLYAQKSNEILQTAFSRAAEQITTQLIQLDYSDSFRTVMEANSYSQLSPETLNDFLKTIRAKSNLPDGSAISVSGRMPWYSASVSHSTLVELDARMSEDRITQSLGLLSPEETLQKKHYLVFGSGYFVKGRKIGNVYITLDPNMLVDSLAIINQPEISFVLADNYGNMMLLSSTSSDMNMDSLEKILQGENSSGRYVTEQTSLSQLDCTLYSIVDTSVVFASIQSMYHATIAALVLLILISLLGSIYFARALIHPLSRFSRYLSELRSNENILTRHSTSIERAACREIREIEEQFSALLDSIAELSAELQQKTNSLHQAELLRRDMEIQNLRSQINPHFLYNTLELIRSDATAGRIDQVSAITAAVGRFYRYSIKGSSIVTLKEEMEHVKAYLTIQQERFSGKISVLYNISPEAEMVPIPKMILQPLVENAIVHGLEPVGCSGILFVGATIQEGVLTISIRDNGIGISSQELAELEQQLLSPPQDRTSIGLANVSERLRLQYGSACAFRIESSPDDGTCIYLELPVFGVDK